MRFIFAAGMMLAGTLALWGCKSEEEQQTTATIAQALPPAPAEGDDVVATIRGEPITQKDLQPVLMKGYGLNVLLLLVQRDLVKGEAERMHVVVTKEDIANEVPLTLVALKKAARQISEMGGPSTQPDDLTPEESQQLLDQVLTQQHVSRAEFDIVMEVNAYLRKIAQPQVAAEMTDEAVRKQFNVMYGEKVLVEYVVLNDMQQAADVRRDLAAGKSFADVARARSLDKISAPSGGELPPFTAMDNGLPADFRLVAFQLKKGEVSDPIQIKNYIYIMKLMDRIPPAHAKFEDYKAFVRKTLYEQAVSAAMAAMRKRLGQMALDSMSIKDPELRKQWEERVEKQTGSLHDMSDIRRAMDKEHEQAAPAATAGSAPATGSGPNSAPGAPAASSRQAAPATKPAAVR